MKYKISFLEDNRTQTLILKLAFSSFENVDVSYFMDGKSLIKSLEHHPDIAIIDLILPDIGGFEMLREIKKKSPKTKVVVVSAQEEVGIIAKLQQEGIFNYIVKSEHSLVYLRRVIKDLITILDAAQI